MYLVHRKVVRIKSELATDRRFGTLVYKIKSRTLRQKSPKFTIDFLPFNGYFKKVAFSGLTLYKEYQVFDNF